jgi:protein-L-isoaspartate(D-aspartate) O-methyltransferase
MEERAIPAVVGTPRILIDLGTHDVRVDCHSSGPYDAIHVGAAAPSLPQELVDQLASPGRMFIPVGSYIQYIEQVDKDEHGNVTTKRVMGVSVSEPAILVRQPCANP